jgi:hypothetical protein
MGVTVTKQARVNSYAAAQNGLCVIFGWPDLFLTILMRQLFSKN